ncbi:MAG TPA: hypothetical protein VMU34_04400, partial [Mycobacterium sp.]|nr:hypothetical protein [Mycobacterium sp.]
AVAALPLGVAATATGGLAPARQFAYTGHEQTYTVPPGVVMLGVAVEGGHGGQAGDQAGEGGGRDGGVGALLPVKPHQKLYIEVGAAGTYNGGPVFGGGGKAGAPPPVVGRDASGAPNHSVYASSGGGASDVRTCGLTAAKCPGGIASASTRLIVGGGGGGEAGSGNGPQVTCSANTGGGRANSFQFLPGNAGAGPLPIVTAAGTVYPGYPTSDAGSKGVTPAGGGSTKPGTGGAQAGCSAGTSIHYTDSVAGKPASGPVGGSGGDASSLGPMDPTCGSNNSCFDAGPGGGGGGGYFGGGGGATGLDKTSGNCGVCNSAGAGQGGGGGSSFVARELRYPVDESLVQTSWNGWAEVVPVIEIDAPLNGAVYHRGQVVHAHWQCGYDSKTNLGFSSGCKGTAADGARLDTSAGRHRFTVSGMVSANGSHAVAATVVYTVR